MSSPLTPTSRTSLRRTPDSSPSSRVALALAARNLSPLQALAVAAALAAALTLVACSGASAPEALACSAHDQCPGDSFCREGACVPSAPPVARIVSLQSEARAKTVLAFDAGESGDPDAEDEVVAFRWSARKVTAECDPLVVDDPRAPVFRVVAPCPGKIVVEVVVSDTAGIASAPEAMPLDVLPELTGPQAVPPPAVTAGESLSLQHRCEGTPLACTPVADEGEATFALSATVTGGREPLTLHWTATPPEGITGYSVGFSDASSPAPVVSLSTTGRIAGTWAFTALVTDADGRAAVAVQEVAIGNRSPVIVSPVADAEVHHWYDSGAAAYRAGGGVSAQPSFVDPDGDPVTLRYAAEASGDGGHGFTVAADGTFSIRIPAAEPHHLIGAGVERRIAIEGDDGNGGRASVTTAVRVLNRPPRVALARGVTTVSHAYDRSRQVYTAAAAFSDYVDDDGDPLSGVVTGGQSASICGRPSLSGATLWVNCEVPRQAGALAAIAKTHALDVAVQDPWASSPAAQAQMNVTNNPPQVIGSTVWVPTSRRQGGYCCMPDGDDPNKCAMHPLLYETAADATFSGVQDPDGDPLDVSYVPGSSAVMVSAQSVLGCTGEECSIALRLAPAGAPMACPPAPQPGKLRVSVTDGLQSASADVVVDRLIVN